VAGIHRSAVRAADDGEQLATYQRCTGRGEAPAAPAGEAWLVIGRRGGKSFILALVAVFLACFHDWRPHLSPASGAPCS